ncbi:uncharacterized protein [Rutidosis leptorrhynchoides]|uniref:uncharacterized protein n=1 Tax=Rutidosis leptorrhynchoides TaxID=125765 RepID=UPI003A9A4B30
MAFDSTSSNHKSYQYDVFVSFKIVRTYFGGVPAKVVCTVTTVVTTVVGALITVVGAVTKIWIVAVAPIVAPFMPFWSTVVVYHSVLLGIAYCRYPVLMRGVFKEVASHTYEIGAMSVKTIYKIGAMSVKTIFKFFFMSVKTIYNILVIPLKAIVFPLMDEEFARLVLLLILQGTQRISGEE